MFPNSKLVQQAVKFIGIVIILIRFPKLKILLGKKDVSVDFAYKAIENLYFLLPAVVLALNRFMHKDFFDQRI